MIGGIWIRSQNESTLAFIDVVEYARYGAEYARYSKEKKIKNVIVGNRILDLGMYSTDTRALEILKEIQESILSKKKVYEMPKE